MKRLLILTALLPFVGFTQPTSTLNDPDQPGHQTPSQQRMQTQMQTQRIQQKGMPNQQLKAQTQLQQRHLENQIDNNPQRVSQSQPGKRNSTRQQMLPNTNGEMLNSNRNPNSSLNQQHMLPERRNGDMSNQPSTPQPDVPLRIIGL